MRSFTIIVIFIFITSFFVCISSSDTQNAEKQNKHSAQNEQRASVKEGLRHVEITLEGEQSVDTRAVSPVEEGNIISSSVHEMESRDETHIPSITKSAILPPKDIPLPGSTNELHKSHPRYHNPRVTLPLSIPAHVAWDIVSNLDQNRNFHSGVASQSMLNTPVRGVGATRWTKTIDGSEVIDRVVEWIPGKRHVVQILIQPHDYPFEIGSKEIMEILTSSSGEVSIALELQVLVKEKYDLEALGKAIVQQLEELALEIDKFGQVIMNQYCKSS